MITITDYFNFAIENMNKDIYQLDYTDHEYDILTQSLNYKKTKFDKAVKKAEFQTKIPKRFLKNPKIINSLLNKKLIQSDKNHKHFFVTKLGKEFTRIIYVKNIVAHQICYPQVRRLSLAYKELHMFFKYGTFKKFRELAPKEEKNWEEIKLIYGI